MAETSYLTYVQCALGLEESLAQELATLPQLEALASRVLEGGVELRTSEAQLWTVCLASRLAESVRLRLKAFRARDFDALQQGLKKLPFRAFLAPGSAVAVRVHCKESRLWHSGAVEERALQVLTEYVGCRHVDAADEQQSVHVVYLRLEKDEVQVSLEAAGLRLHRRGYRKQVERASLRETLAFALCQTAAQHWSAGEHHHKSFGRDIHNVGVWDPFCGAGTIPLEWAHWRLGRLCGENKELMLEHFARHDATRFAAHKAQLTDELAERALSDGSAATSVRIWGSDIAAKALSAARANASEAGLSEAVQWLEGDVLEVAESIPEGTMVITNPPYGKRLEDCGGVKKLAQLLQRRRDLRPAVMLVGGAAKKILPPNYQSALRFKNGGLSVSARLCPS